METQTNQQTYYQNFAHKIFSKDINCDFQALFNEISKLLNDQTTISATINSNSDDNNSKQSPTQTPLKCKIFIAGSFVTQLEMEAQYNTEQLDNNPESDVLFNHEFNDIDCFVPISAVGMRDEYAVERKRDFSKYHPNVVASTKFNDATIHPFGAAIKINMVYITDDTTLKSLIEAFDINIIQIGFSVEMTSYVNKINLLVSREMEAKFVSHPSILAIPSCPYYFTFQIWYRSTQHVEFFRQYDSHMQWNRLNPHQEPRKPLLKIINMTLTPASAFIRLLAKASQLKLPYLLPQNDLLLNAVHTQHISNGQLNVFFKLSKTFKNELKNRFLIVKGDYSDIIPGFDQAKILPQYEQFEHHRHYDSALISLIVHAHLQDKLTTNYDTKMQAKEDDDY